MKNKLLKTLFVLALCVLLTALSLVVVGAEEYTLDAIYDEQGLLSESEYEELYDIIAETSERLERSFNIVTVDNIGYDSEEFAKEVFYNYDLGYGDTEDGVILLLSMSDIDGESEIAIFAGGQCKDEISDSDIDNTVIPEVISHLKDRDYYEGFITFLQLCEEEITSYGEFDLTDLLMDLGIALVIGIIIAVIVVLVLRGQLKSVKFEAAANNYVKDGSFNLTVQRDIFLYRTVTRIARPKSSSSSGGSSGSSGSAKF